MLHEILANELVPKQMKVLKAKKQAALAPVKKGAARQLDEAQQKEVRQRATRHVSVSLLGLRVQI
jgi:hypothetical protein